MIKESDCDILSNTLSNLYDWESEDLEKDFIQFVKSEIPHISDQDLKKLFRDYNELSPLERDHVGFDARSFILKTFIS